MGVATEWRSNKAQIQPQNKNFALRLSELKLIMFSPTEAERGRHTNFVAIDYSKAFDKIDSNVALSASCWTCTSVQDCSYGCRASSQTHSNVYACVKQHQTGLAPHVVSYVVSKWAQLSFWRWWMMSPMTPPFAGNMTISLLASSAQAKHLFLLVPCLRPWTVYVPRPLMTTSPSALINVLCCRSVWAETHHLHWTILLMDSMWPPSPTWAFWASTCTILSNETLIF